MKMKIAFFVIASALLAMLAVGCENGSTDDDKGGDVASTEQVVALNTLLTMATLPVQIDCEAAAKTLQLTDYKFVNHAAYRTTVHYAVMEEEEATGNTSIMMAYTPFALGTGNASQYALVFPYYKDAVTTVNAK